jgi:ABC-type uncharacterized transport system permease subunit
MNLLLPALLAIVAYIVAIALQWRTLNGQSTGSPEPLRLAAIVAVIAHLATWWQQLVTPTGYDFGIFVVASTANWLAVLLVLVFSLRSPIENLLLLVCPPALLALAASLLPFAHSNVLTQVEPEHIVPSLLAYSVLFLAACQAVLLAVQDRRLRNSKSLIGMRLLPPLQVMENLLFELLWVGLVLLSIAIATGLFFLDDMFEQHVVHHSVLSMSSWLVFAVLLWGRYTLGWRGTTAVRWTIVGFLILALAYFGSKAVVELLLQR